MPTSAVQAHANRCVVLMKARPFVCACVCVLSSALQAHAISALFLLKASPFVCAYVCVNMRVHMDIFEYKRTYVCVWVDVWGCVGYMYVCMYIYM